jgi:hypothetical protein
MVELVHHPMVASITSGVTALTAPVGELDSVAAIGTWLRANIGDYVPRWGRAGWAHRTIRRVVDTECRVIGYDGLRVCDASVMPDLPKANTHLTTVAIAERLIELMRG